MAEKVEKKTGFFDRAKKYFAECRAELKKVTWPTKEQLIKNSAVIIVFVAIITAILSLLDVGFGWIFTVLTTVL